MTRLLASALLACLMFLPVAAPGQQSDFAVKNDFESRHERLARLIETSTTTAQLDTLRNEIDGLALDFAPHTEFLDKALYPASVESKIKELRDMHARLYDAARIMETQGTQIIAMETSIQELTFSLDTLAKQRDALFAEMQQNKNDVVALRETVRRLQAHMQAKDQLLFSLVDSMFMPYGKDLANVGTDVRDDLAAKIEKTNVLSRVYDIASDNVRFLTATEFQGKDFTSLLNNYHQFSIRWKGLSEKMHTVYLAGQPAGQKTAQGKKGAAGLAPSVPVVQVDSLLAEWNTVLRRTFWSTIEKEFAVRGVAMIPFSDAPGFSASIRAYVDQAKNSGEDASVFVDEVWKGRIDKEWKDALSHESILGKAEYAALDAMVRELTPPMLDMKYVLYIGIILIVALVLWWILARKAKQPAQKPSGPTA